jgi:hypothetical protein
MRIGFFMIVIFLSSYCDADESYFVLKVTLDKQIGEIIDVDNFYKQTESNRKVLSASIDGRESNFPVLYVDKKLNGKYATFVFDMPLGIKEAEVGTIANVVMMLKPEYMSLSCTSIIHVDKLSNPVVLVLENGKLHAASINVLARLSNNTCIAKSVVSSDGCVVDKPNRFKVSQNQYRVPGGNNCGNNGMRHIYIKLQGEIDNAE